MNTFMATRKKKAAASARPPRPPAARESKKQVKYPKVAARLKEARKDAGLSQREIATQLSIGTVAVSELFQGKTNPRRETFIGVCRILKRRPGWIWGGEGERVLTDESELDEWMPPPPVSGKNAGLSQWLSGTQEGKSVTPAERKLMTAFPWPQVPVRAPDDAYHYMLVAIRILLQSQKS